MNQYPHEGRISALVRIAGRRWLVLAIVILAVMIITFCYNFFFVDPIYQAQVKIIYPLKRGAGFIKSSLGALDIPIRGFQTILDVEPTIYNHIVIMRSRTVREKVVDMLDLGNHYKILQGKSEDSKRRGAAKILGLNMTINDAIKGAVVVKIKDHDNQMAATIANTVIEATSEYLIELYNETYGMMVDFLRERQNEVQKDLDVVEEEMRLLKEQTGILSVDAQAEQMITTYAEIEQALIKAEIDYRGALAGLSATENFSDEVREYLAAIERGEIDPSDPYSTFLIGGEGKSMDQPQPIAGALEDTNIAFLRRQLSELELELATKRIAFTDEHPDIIILSDQVEDARKALNEELLKYYDAALATLEIESIGYSAQVEVIHDLLDEFKQRMGAYPTDERELLELERDKKVKESILLVVEQELEEAEIRQKKIELPFTILDEALPPRSPIAPRLIVNTVVMGAIAAWITLYLIFWHETRARRKAAAAAAEGTS
jgi:uncharacterized protein involved in exopolysaccharide biosynthesis